MVRPVSSPFTLKPVNIISDIVPKPTNKYTTSSSDRLCIAFVNCLDSVKNLQMQNALKEEELDLESHLLNDVLSVYIAMKTNVSMQI